MTPDFISYLFGVLVGLFGGFLLTRYSPVLSNFINILFGKDNKGE